MIKYVSDGTQFNARLVVYRDFIESNGKWRLFWENPNDIGCGFNDESTVTGQPFFSRKRDAVEYGVRRYNERAISQTW